MLTNAFIKKYFGMSVVLFITTPIALAGANVKYTITPITSNSQAKPNVMNLLLNANLTFQYMVQNHTKRTSPPLYLTTNIPGLTQITNINNVCQYPFQLAPGASCILRMQMTGTTVGRWGGSGSLVLNSGDGTVGLQPSPDNLLNITVSDDQNMYISYMSATPAGEIASYINSNNLGGVIMWELRGDTPFSPISLLGAINANFINYSANPHPFIMSYWSNWNVYSNGADRAIPEPAYAVPGSYDNNGALTTNADFSAKLAGLNYLAYDFLEVQALTFTYYDSASGQTFTIANQTPTKIGTLYLNDPWADLLKPSSETLSQNSFCGYPNATNPICNFALQNRTTPIALENGAIMGNFQAFANLTRTPNQLGSLNKIFSVGGYGHDDSFESMFNSCPGGSMTPCINNFVNSAVSIINNYGLNGIDLDYENPDMSHTNSANLATLVSALHTALPGKTVSVTILSDPTYLAGNRVCSSASPTPGQAMCGFSAGTLGAIDQAATNINLMTYDYYGAFNYPGATAFLTNLNSYSFGGQSTTFSVVSSVNAALAAGVTHSKLSAGIPAYGRALNGIGSTNGGLLQPIPATASIPRGDLDSVNCSQSIGTAVGSAGSDRENSVAVDSGATCTGSFQYWFIVKEMLASPTTSPGLTQTEYTGGMSPVAGTTAYGASWSPPSTPTLTLVNGGTNGDLAFNITIGTNPGTYPNYFQAPDYFAPGTSITYQASSYNTPSTNITDGGAPINWSTNFAVGPQLSGTCPSPLPPLTKNTVVSITVNNQAATNCSVSP